MPEEIQDNGTVGEQSSLQPVQNEPPITLKDAQKEIEEAIERAKEGFLKTAKTEATEEIRKQVQTDKASLITVFGIFASIISFLTIEFQFLRTICSLEKLLGFTLILASLLLCFNLALDYLVKSRTDKETPKPNIIFGIFVVILFTLGIYYTSLGNEAMCQDNKIFEKYSENFLDQQEEFNKTYGSEQDKKYNEIQSDVNNIKMKMNK